MKNNWDSYFLKIAEVIRTKSKDTNTTIGVVIVGPNNEIRSTGYNSFPRGINDNVSSRFERPEKYFWFEHAERNAIYNAARVGIPLEGCIMYCTCDVSCSDCARAIINSGIKEVVFVRGGGAKSQKWDEEAKRSREMFEEAGVLYRYNNEVTDA